MSVYGSTAPEDFLSDPQAGTPLESSSTGNLPVVEPVSPLRRLQLTEPVRLYLRPVLVAVLALLVSYGVVDEHLAPLWDALIGAVLAVGGHYGIEALRGAVVSPRTNTTDAFRAGRAAAAAEREHALTITTRAAAATLAQRFPLS